jgi:hypothetical protein
MTVDMLKRWMHMMILLVFVLSTMPGVVIALPMTASPMMHHKMTELSDHQHQHKQHHVSSDMQVDHSCCNAEQTVDTQNKYNYKLCCQADCQCMMNDCPKPQSFYLVPSLVFHELFQTTGFIINNDRHDDFVVNLLERPPKA